MKWLSQVQPDELKGKRVLLRLDLNVPSLEDVDRIKKSEPTITFLKNAGAKVIIISHIGRDPKESLQAVAEYMNIPLVTEVPEDFQVVMLENLRQSSGEEANDEAFAKQFASYADIYVNDAFAVSHRAHASIVSIPKFLPSYAGLQMEQEIRYLSQAFNAEHPSMLVLGGAKFETKLPVIRKLLPIMDTIIIGGALANNFYKEMGYETGLSLIDDTVSIADLVHNSKIILSQKVIIENEQGQEEKNITEVSHADKIVDIAPSGLDEYYNLFKETRFILWNGPMGNYENGFTAGSKKIIDLITESGRTSIVGGGDSVAMIEGLGLENKFTFLSTGGGAMLEYLANGTLPGIEALESTK